MPTPRPRNLVISLPPFNYNPEQTENPATLMGRCLILGQKNRLNPTKNKKLLASGYGSLLSTFKNIILFKAHQKIDFIYYNFLILNAEINFTTLPKLINVQNSDQGVTEVFKTLAHLQLGYTASKLKRSNSNIYFRFR